MYAILASHISILHIINLVMAYAIITMPSSIHEQTARRSAAYSIVSKNLIMPIVILLPIAGVTMADAAIVQRCIEAYQNHLTAATIVMAAAWFITMWICNKWLTYLAYNMPLENKHVISKFNQNRWY